MKNTTNLKFPSLNYSIIEKLYNILSSDSNNLETNNKKSLEMSVNLLKNFNTKGAVNSSNSVLSLENKQNLELNSVAQVKNSGDNALSFFKNYPKLQNVSTVENLNLTRVSRYMKTISNFYPEIALNQEVVYSFMKGGKKYSINNIYSILESCFNPMYSLISKPIFKFHSNKVVIFLFFYLIPGKTAKLNGKNFLAVNQKRIEFVCEILSKIFNRPIVLELTRLYHPFADSNILANTIGPISDLNPFIKIRRRILKSAKIINPSNVKNRFNNKSIFGILSDSPSFLSGIKISIKGRLLIQKVIPRKTTYNFQRGSLARAKANFVQTSRFTNKNKRGAYSITVNIGHGFK
jgi:hypothetical protein